MKGGDSMNKAKSSRILFSILLIVLTLFSTATIAYADTEDSNISPCYSSIDKNYAQLDITGVKAKCFASLSTKSPKNLKIVMELQKKKSNGYETVKTWTSSKTGTRLSMSESRNINALCTYRLKVTYTAGSEQVVAYKY